MASTGVLHGEAASANTRPAKYACTAEGRPAASSRASTLPRKEGKRSGSTCGDQERQSETGAGEERAERESQKNGLASESGSS